MTPGPPSVQCACSQRKKKINARTGNWNMCVIFMGSFQYWPQSLPCGIGIEYDSESRTLKCYLPLNSGVPQGVIVLALSV